MIRSSTDKNHLLIPSPKITSNPALLSQATFPDRTNNDFENDREDAKIPRSSFSKSLSFLDTGRQRKSVSPSPPKPSSMKEMRELRRQSSFDSFSSFCSTGSLSSSSSSSSSPPIKPKRKKVIDNEIDNRSSSTSSIPDDSGHTVSSVLLMKKSIMPWKKKRNNKKGTKKKKMKEAAATTASNSDEQPSSSPSSEKDTEKKRVVKFNRKVRIRKIPRIVDTPEEELEATFYSNQEMIDMRNMLRAKIRVINEEKARQETIRANRSANSGTDNSSTIIEEFFEDDDRDREEEEEEEDEYEDEMVICCNAYNDENCDCCLINDYFNHTDNDDEQCVTCLRGLEHEFPKGKHRRRKNKAIARDIVLEEQRYFRKRQEQQQKKMKKRDADATTKNLDDDDDLLIVEEEEDPIMAIAEAYRTESLPSLQQAIRTGKNDAYTANRIYNSNNSNDIDDSKHSTATDSTFIIPSSCSSTCSWTERNGDDCNSSNNNGDNVFVFVKPASQ